MKDEQTVLPSFQTQILKNDLAVVLTEKDSVTSLDLGGVDKIENILDVISLRDMLTQVIDNYLELNDGWDDCKECCECNEEDCDSHVGPCYVG